MKKLENEKMKIGRNNLPSHLSLDLSKWRLFLDQMGFLPSKIGAQTPLFFFGKSNGEKFGCLVITNATCAELNFFKC